MTETKDFTLFFWENEVEIGRLRQNYFYNFVVAYRFEFDLPKLRDDKR